MAILTSLYTGISGLGTNGSSLSVIGDNIANMNTVAFKGSRASFGDILSGSLTGGGGGQSQVGRGVFLTSVGSDFSQGSFQTTSNTLDMAIDGDGMFIVDSAEGRRAYTRAGSFRLNKDGYITNPEGMRLQGYAFDANGVSTGVLGTINLGTLGSSPNPTSSIAITANLDSRSSGSNIVVDATNNTIVFTDTASRTATITAGTYTGAGLATAIKTALEAANAAADTYTVTFDSSSNRFNVANDAGNANAIDLNWEDASTTAGTILGFNNSNHAAIAVGSSGNSDTAASLYKAPFDADNPATTSDFSAAVTVYDSLGNDNQVTVYFRKNQVLSTGNAWQWYAVTPASSSTSGVNTIGASGTLTFSVNGAYSDMTTDTGPDFDFSGGATQSQTIDFDFTTLTQFATTSSTTFQSQDGYAPGSLQSMSINTDGVISGSFTNGQSRNVAQVGLAKFTAPEGLVKLGGNLFTESPNSGQPLIGEPNTAGRGKLLSATLELSNVDLASEFVAMIAAQRGFQANSKVVSTTDEIMNELVNLKR
ncbi:MAG: flagellar hook protein FlgE [Nitrospirae bacterium]|nr:flagellar hook protein FlgE [Nitrospirota bacterium]